MKDFIIRWAALIGIGVASFFVGLQYERQTAQPQIVTQVVTQVKEVEKIVTKRVVVTKVVKPDGTVTERTETEDKVADKATDASTNTVKQDSKYIPRDWRLGIQFSPVSYIPVGGSIDRRILGDIWLGVSAEWVEPQIRLGVSIEL
jgi:hypothetical protein